MASERPFGQRVHSRAGLIWAGLAGVILGAGLFIAALFAYTPKAPAARTLGVDERIVGIPANCDVARAAGIAPMARGSGFYNPKLDWDGDGLACEPSIFGIL